MHPEWVIHSALYIPAVSQMLGRCFDGYVGSGSYYLSDSIQGKYVLPLQKLDVDLQGVQNNIHISRS